MFIVHGYCVFIKTIKFTNTLIIICVDNTRIKPQTNILQVGSSTKFICQSSEPVTWRSVGGWHRQPNVKHLNGNIILVDSVNKTNTGYIECEGKTELKESFAARGYLKVIGIS